MPPLDYPGARQRLYAVRELARDESSPERLGAGLIRGRFLGVYRTFTPHAALLTAKIDHPKVFERASVLCTDLSSYMRLVSHEVSCAVWVIAHMDGTMTMGQLTPMSPVVQAAQGQLKKHPDDIRFIA